MTRDVVVQMASRSPRAREVRISDAGAERTIGGPDNLATSDAMQVAVELDVPEPVEAGFGEGRVERLAVTLLRLRRSSVNIEYERFDHDDPFLRDACKIVNGRRGQATRL